MPLRFGLLLLLCSSRLTAAEPGPPTVVAARQREAAIRSIEFVCRVKQTIRRGALGTAAGQPEADGRKPVPEVDRVLEGTSRLICDGARFRLESDAPFLGGLHPNYQLAAQNGRELRHLNGYLSPTRRADGNPAGRVSQPMDVGVYPPVLAPVVLVCRWSWHSNRGRSLPTPTGESMDIDGVACDGYRANTPLTLWVDPRPGHLVRRITEKVSGFSTRCDIHYENHPGIGPLPAGWKWTQFGPTGAVRCTMDVTAEALHVNEAFADELFELKFPPKTHVYRGRESFQVNEAGEEVPDVPPAPPPKPAWEPSGEQKLGIAAVAVGAVALIGWRWRAGRKPA